MANKYDIVCVICNGGSDPGWAGPGWAGLGWAAVTAHYQFHPGSSTEWVVAAAPKEHSHSSQG